MNRVVHFEIPAEDPEKLVKFYSEVFGWQIEKWEDAMDYWMITTGNENEPGINGAIMKKEDQQSTIVNVIEVDSIDELLDSIEANGGTILTGKMPVPGIGYAANFRDTQGNVFGVMQPDPSVT